MALISCKNLQFQYDGLTVLSNLSFDVNCGDYLCIIGKNGSGKTTVVNGLLGLLKPKSGEITISDELPKNSIGYLPQQNAIQKDFPASVFEVVLSGCLNKRGIRPFYSKSEKNIAEKNMKLLEIDQIKNKCYNELSGGQQQRVLLARALCSANRLLLLDEPVRGLDPIGINSMYDIIAKLNKEYHITIIMVSHDISNAVKHASHILHLNDTSIFFGTTEEYIKSDFAKKITGGSEK